LLFPGDFMVKRNYRVQSMTVELPSLISNGLDSATKRYKLSKSDIVRSVIYDFLVSSGILPENEELNRPDDRNINCIGRRSSLLTME